MQHDVGGARRGCCSILAWSEGVSRSACMREKKSRRYRREGESGTGAQEGGIGRSATAGEDAGDDRPMRKPGCSGGGVLACTALGWQGRALASRASRLVGQATCLAGQKVDWVGRARLKTR